MQVWPGAFTAGGLSRVLLWLSHAEPCCAMLRHLERACTFQETLAAISHHAAEVHVSIYEASVPVKTWRQRTTRGKRP